MLVACLQVDPSDPARAWETVSRALREAVCDRAQVIVLPELALTGFDTTDPAHTQGRALPSDAPPLQQLAAATKDSPVVVVAGFAERDGASIRNSAAVCFGGEVVAVYRKVHLWGDEPDHFEAAAAPPLVLNTPAGRLAVMICYDLEFPEWVRIATQLGAELIAVPVNWPRYGDPPYGELPIEIRKAQAAAATYRVPIAIADRCGRQGGLDWLGGTCLVSSDGYLAAGPLTPPRSQARPGRLLAELTPTSAADRWIGPRNHCLDDRRPELYRETTGEA